MTLYEERKAKMMENSRIRKENETTSFLGNIDKIINNTDSIVMPSMQIMKETEKCYINYHVTKYPNCLSYSLTMYKKDHPFNIYYTKEFYKHDIPTKYSEVFTQLEEYFN